MRRWSWILWLGVLACKPDKDDDTGTDTDTDTTDAPVAPDKLVINEVGAEAFIELLNADNVDIELDRYQLRVSSSSGEIQNHALSGTLAPQEMLLIEQASLSFQLEEGGDTVLLLDTAGNTVDEADWGNNDAFPSWGRYPDGIGQWRTLLIPTPGAPNTDAVPDNPSPIQVVINEVVATGDPVDLIELYSLEAATVNLDGWWYIDSGQDGREMIDIPSVGPGGVVVLDSHNFGLKASGELLLLFDAENRLVDQVEWGDGEADISYCRIPDGVGEPGPCNPATMGEPNAP